MKIEEIKKANTKYLGKSIYYYESLPSTQDMAKEMLQEAMDGTIILADRQTKGKGTKGRTWYTGSKDNIAMTMLLKPKDTKIDELSEFTLTVAGLLKETIRELYGYELSIKMPNDLLLNGKKIAGILTECATRQSQVNYILIGVGFNVNETDFSKETQEIATSLKKEYGKPFSKEEIIVTFIEKLENYVTNRL